MTDEIQRLEAEIAQLSQTIANLANMPDAQAVLQPQLAAKQAALVKLTQPTSPQSYAAGRDLNLATYQTINNFFDGQPGEDGEQLLRDYLSSLIGECRLLRLSRLTERERRGSGEEATPDVQLQQIFTSLTIDGDKLPASKKHRYQADKAIKLLKRYFKRDYSADSQLPEHVRSATVRRVDGKLPIEIHTWEEFERLDATVPVDIQLMRPPLAAEAVLTQRLLVLLGEPGSGKSTVLRHVALQLAESLLAPQNNKAKQSLPIPIYLPLARVARILPNTSKDADAALLQALRELLDAGTTDGLRQGLSRFLQPALRQGGVILLCDGLDELPFPEPRTQVSQALARLAQTITAHMVVTSRVKPYTSPGAWQLPADEGWRTHTIQPLAFGQVQAFVRRWYSSLAQPRAESISPARFTQEAAEQRSSALLDDLRQQERVRALVQSPLLLTMLAILHGNSESGSIPRDRALLYEECVQLVLERWEPVRTPGMQRPGLLARLGNIPNLTLGMLREMIHELAFQAHDQPPGDDGRGVIDQEKLDGKLLRVLRNLGAQQIDEKITIFVTVLREEIGLLQERGDQSFVLPHLTFEEYLAACYLADRADMADLALARWEGPDRERWRGILLLLMGRLRQQGKLEDKALPWLQRLLATHSGRGQQRSAKPAAQQRSETLLAALSYRELDSGAAFATSASDIETLLDQPLRSRVAALLSEPDSRILTPDRISCAQLLGQLGDPRFPITIEDWRQQLAQRKQEFGRPDGYFCFLPAGTYTIGGWEAGDPSAALDIPAFWIARLPITVAQYGQFMQDAGYSTERWWTGEGWTFRNQQGRNQPRRWDDAGYTANSQPVIGVTWYEAVAFCRWLSEQIQSSLPDGYAVRLPTEAEWELAAAWDGQQRRPYPWGNPEPSTELAIYDALQLDAPAPVGCCPAGATACGALDLAGNVWEWTCSSYKAYPKQASIIRKDFTPGDMDVPRRGGSYYHNSTFVRCGTRYWYFPDGIYVDDFGFRILVASPLAQ